MKKLIKLSFKNTSSIREIEDSYSEVYSHDRNNGNFEFKVEDELLTDERVIALFKFLKSKKVWKTEGLIEEGVIKVKFDNTLITRDEPVVCYLYLDGSEVDSDVFKFKFDVKLSEIDKVKDLPEKERYFKNSIVVDRVDVLTRDVLDEEVATLKKSFIVRDDLTGLVNQEALTKAKTDVLNEVNELGFIKEHQDLTGYAKSTEIPDVTGFVKDTALETLKTEILKEVDDEGFLKQHQSLEGLLTKDALDKKLEEVVSQIPQPNLTDYVTTTALNEKLKDVVSKLPQPDLSGYVREQTFNDFKATLNTSGSELRGNGIPYGKAAKIGTIYIDEDVTNGAMRWLKTKDSWKVIDGDTGWVDVPVKNVQPNTKMQLRRINNLVHVRFFNELAEGLAKFADLYNTDPTTHYLTIFKGLASFGWRPTTPYVQVIFSEVSQGGTDYAYNTSHSPQPYLRMGVVGTDLNVDMQLDEFSVTNNNFGVYINSFSYLTDDDWPPSLNVI
jgi:hypothetical protein|nr:MAG TPA: hypothetical protein [Caudoviricetes sp.]